jgi:hypothetical protein
METQLPKHVEHSKKSVRDMIGWLFDKSHFATYYAGKQDMDKKLPPLAVEQNAQRAGAAAGSGSVVRWAESLQPARTAGSGSVLGGTELSDLDDDSDFDALKQDVDAGIQSVLGETEVFDLDNDSDFDALKQKVDAAIQKASERIAELEADGPKANVPDGADFHDAVGLEELQLEKALVEFENRNLQEELAFMRKKEEYLVTKLAVMQLAKSWNDKFFSNKLSKLCNIQSNLSTLVEQMLPSGEQPALPRDEKFIDHVRRQLAGERDYLGYILVEIEEWIAKIDDFVKLKPRRDETASSGAINSDED